MNNAKKEFEEIKKQAKAYAKQMKNCPITDKESLASIIYNAYLMGADLACRYAIENIKELNGNTAE